MPDIVRLRYSGPDSMTVPVIGRAVEPGDVVELPGKVLKADEDGNPLPDEHDAVVVEFGNPPVIRAFPTSVWAVVVPRKSRAAAEAKADAEVPADDETDEE